jgi:hypothetical protein
MRMEDNADGSLPAPCVDIPMVVSISVSHYIERVVEYRRDSGTFFDASGLGI